VRHAAGEEHGHRSRGGEAVRLGLDRSARQGPPLVRTQRERWIDRSDEGPRARSAVVPREDDGLEDLAGLSQGPPSRPREDQGVGRRLSDRLTSTSCSSADQVNLAAAKANVARAIISMDTKDRILNVKV